MITQFQSLYFKGNFAGTVKAGGYEVPSIAAIADAYGIPYFKVACVSDVDMRMLKGPALVEVDMGEGETTVVPKLQFDHNLDDMTPPFGTSAK